MCAKKSYLVVKRIAGFVQYFCKTFAHVCITVMDFSLKIKRNIFEILSLGTVCTHSPSIDL
jgi:hypothetical protein